MTWAERRAWIGGRPQATGQGVSGAELTAAPRPGRPATAAAAATALRCIRSGRAENKQGEADATTHGRTRRGIGGPGPSALRPAVPRRRLRIAAHRPLSPSRYTRSAASRRSTPSTRSTHLQQDRGANQVLLHRAAGRRLVVMPTRAGNLSPPGRAGPAKPARPPSDPATRKGPLAGGGAGRAALLPVPKGVGGSARPTAAHLASPAPPQPAPRGGGLWVGRSGHRKQSTTPR